jgi:hypothetical protein
MSLGALAHAYRRQSIRTRNNPRALRLRYKEAILENGALSQSEPIIALSLFENKIVWRLGCPLLQ